MTRIRIWGVWLSLLFGSCGRTEPPPAPPAPPPSEKPAPPALPEAKAPPVDPRKPSTRPALPPDIQQKLAQMAESLGPTAGDPDSVAKLKEELRRKLEGSAPDQASGTTPAAVPPSQFPRTPPPEDPPVPRLYLTANGSDDGEIPEGSPLILAVSIQSSSAGVLHLASANNSWTSLLHLQLPDGAWKPVPVSVADRELTVEQSGVVTVHWTLLPEELSTLPRGAYTLKASLVATEPVAGAWTGILESYPARVRLVKATPRLSQREELARASLLVQCQLLRGHPEEARSPVQSAIKKYPKRPEFLVLQADVEEGAGRVAEALQALDRAIAASAGDKTLPPGYGQRLVRRREELAARASAEK